MDLFIGSGSELLLSVAVIMIRVLGKISELATKSLLLNHSTQ
jgi:hypothetical protein